MIKTKNTELQKILDHYNPDIPNKAVIPKIGLDTAIELFGEWCQSEGLLFTKNSAGFIVDNYNNTIIRPDYIINGKYYVHIILGYNKNIHEKPYTKFKEHYGKIMVIPKDVVPEFIVLADANYFFKRFTAK